MQFDYNYHYYEEAAVGGEYMKKSYLSSAVMMVRHIGHRIVRASSSYHWDRPRRIRHVR
jgi:hypothetical protein